MARSSIRKTAEEKAITAALGAYRTATTSFAEAQADWDAALDQKHRFEATLDGAGRLRRLKAEARGEYDAVGAEHERARMAILREERAALHNIVEHAQNKLRMIRYNLSEEDETAL